MSKHNPSVSLSVVCLFAVYLFIVYLFIVYLFIVYLSVACLSVFCVSLCPSVSKSVNQPISIAVFMSVADTG